MTKINEEIRQAMLSVTTLCDGTDDTLMRLESFRNGYKSNGINWNFQTQVYSTCKEDDYWHNMFWKAIEKMDEAGQDTSEYF